MMSGTRARGRAIGMGPSAKGARSDASAFFARENASAAEAKPTVGSSLSAGLVFVRRPRLDMNTQPRWRQAFEITTTVCMLACGVALWWEVPRGSGDPPPSAAADVRAQAGRLGLNVSAFDECLRREPLGTIQADKAEAAELRITGTPAFLVGTLRNGEDVQVRATIAGAKPYEEFQTTIENLLKVK